MKVLALIGVLFFASVAMASDLHCDGVDDFEISNKSLNVGNWSKITITKSGVKIISDLNDNGGFFLQKDEVTDEWVQIIRGATVKSGVISSLILSIRLDASGGKSGIGNAIIFDGTDVIVVNGLNCLAP